MKGYRTAYIPIAAQKQKTCWSGNLRTAFLEVRMRIGSSIKPFFGG
jgi:hypothetical protein